MIAPSLSTSVTSPVVVATNATASHVTSAAWPARSSSRTVCHTTEPATTSAVITPALTNIRRAA